MGLAPILLCGFGPVQNFFPMRFYRRWRQFKQQVICPKTSKVARGPRIDIPHEYLAINEVEGPLLLRCNRTVSNVYPPLPAKSSSSYSNDPQTLYVDQGHKMTTTSPPREALYTARVQLAAARAAPRCTSFLHDPQSGMTPPAADARTSPTFPRRPVGHRQPGLVTSASFHRHPEVSRQHLPEGPHRRGDETKPLNRL